MIPITDRHLREACRLAMEQDIADLEAEPCSHCFSENFRGSIQQMQKEISQKHTAKFTFPGTRPLWRLLPAAAMIALACLAGYRLMELAPFRMGSSSPASAGQEAGASMNDTLEYAAEAETAGAAEDSADSPAAAAGESAATSNETGTETPDVSLDRKNASEESMDEGAVPESAESRTGTAADSSASQEGKKESGIGENEITSGLTLLSTAYDAPTRILELELRNDSARAVVLENNWMLFDADGETVNIETIDPEPPHPLRLTPGKTTIIRCMLPDGELPEGTYTLDPDGGEHILTFSIP